MGIEDRLSLKTRLDTKNKFDRIESILKKCRLTESLKLVSSVSQGIFADRTYWKGPTPPKVHLWVLAYIAKTLLKVTSNTHRDRVLGESDYENVAKLYYSLLDPVAKEIPEFAPLFFMNVTYEQFFWQEPIRNLIPRYYLLFSHRSGESSEVAKYRTELSEHFKKMCGLEIEDYIRLSFCVWVTMRGVGVYRRENLIDTEVSAFRSTFTNDKLALFEKHVSVDMASFRRKAKELDSKVPSLHQYALNPLYSSPLVQVGDTLLAPIPRLLLDKSTTGLYYDLYNHTERGSPNAQYLPNAFGHLVSDYIGTLLGTKYVSSEDYFSADTYDFGDYRGKRCDWIILESGNYILMEVKSSRIPRSVIESWDLDSLRDWLRTRIPGQSVSQLCECADYFKCAHPDSTVSCIVVVIEAFIHFNLLRRYLPADDPMLKGISDYQIQFMNIQDLESIVANHNYTLSDVLREKLQDAEKCSNAFGPVLDQLPGFDYKKPLPLLEQTFDTVFKRDELNANSPGN